MYTEFLRITNSRPKTLTSLYSDLSTHSAESELPCMGVIHDGMEMACVMYIREASLSTQRMQVNNVFSPPIEFELINIPATARKVQPKLWTIAGNQACSALAWSTFSAFPGRRSTELVEIGGASTPTTPCRASPTL
jgi:hypothetical protein